MSLAIITPEIVELIRPHAPIIEIGAGDGTWAQAMKDADVEVRAFDPNPRGSIVETGDHTELANFGHEWTPLIVWPPDSTDIRSWIGDRVKALFAGRPGRVLLPPYNSVLLTSLMGSKGAHGLFRLRFA